MLVVQEGGGTLPAFSRARQLLAKVNAQRRFVVIRRAYARASAKVARDVGFPAGTLWASRQSLLKMGVAVAIVAAVVGILVGAAHGGGSTTSSFPMLIWLGIIAYRMVKRGRSS
jgi:preprotein translocase subunit SecE